MVKAVFTHKPGSLYDDLPEERYHFPAAYRRQVEAAVGDFVVYYEPGRTGTGDRGRTGRRAYVATARVTDVRPDPARPDHFYALIDPTTYLDFDRAVPFHEGERYHERQLRRDDGATSKGAFGRAVRPLSEAEYETIVRAGFAHELDQPPAATLGAQAPAIPAWMLDEPPAPFERPIVERLLSRPLRDAAFARAVQAAYDGTCAMTGLKLVNGGGRTEAQAAHIRPVHAQGPDSIRNGVALSGTVHWLFDRGLISISPPPDYAILFGKSGLPENARRLFHPHGRLAVPRDERLWPAPAYLDWHRERVFKG
jgi:putative restriction endonuclease